MPLWLPTARAEQNVAVSSTVSDGYVRAKLRDGSYQPETYAFGEGGHLSGPMQDDSIDNLTFMDLARVISRPLARRNYVPATERNPEKTKLLIMIYWGTTRGTAGASDSSTTQKRETTQSKTASPPPTPSSVFIARCTCDATTLNAFNSAMAGGASQSSLDSSLAEVAAGNRARNVADMQNALLLGYDSELSTASRHEPTAFSDRREDLMTEVEDNRDFVVLKAYDFQELWKHKKHRLLWVTRLSIRERGTDFGSVLPAMASNASQYFGQDSFGLIHSAIPEGRVEIGDVKTVAMGTAPGK
jgi:hypothetical protein